MIYDNIKNASRYFNIREDLKKGFEKILELETNELGKCVIDGDKIYASVQEYESKSHDKGRFENHEKYIDIQYIAEGEEEIKTFFTDGAVIDTPYSDEKDVEFYKPEEYTTYKMSKGDFLVIYPGEAHAPGLMRNDKSVKVRKVLVKIML